MMVKQIETPQLTEIIYPERDGNPMSDNTVQFRWITTIKANLDWLFAGEEKVFVAGDLLWYPIENNNKKRQAPDVMVVFGRPKGDRGSYQQWKEANIAPQVVFEIISPGNRQAEITKKLLFYDHYGVEEYYIYEPDKNELTGLLRTGNHLEVIENIENWVSPRLGIRFEVAQPELKIYHPNGEAFSTYIQEKQKAQIAQQQAAKFAAKLKELGINPEEI